MRQERTKTVRVGEKSYCVCTWSATKGVRMLTRLVKLMGEPLFMLIMSKDAEDETKRAEIESVLQGAASALVARLDESFVLETLRDCLTETLDGNASVNEDFDSRFAGSLGHLFQLVFQTLKFQYADFFDAAGALARFVPAKKAG